MPRRNRQKLHRELRLKAEALQADRRQRRRRRRALAERTRAAALEALRSRSVCSPRRRASPEPTDALLGCGELMTLARVSDKLQARVRQLLRAVFREIPPLACTAQLPWLLLLAGPRWVRRPDAFVAPSGSLRRKRDALAWHLFAQYPVPPFLLRALDAEPVAVARVPVEDRWAVGLLAAVGRGTSVRALVGSDLLPPPLTRRMCHTLLRARADASPIYALRAAQVEGYGGAPELARRLVRTRLGHLRGLDPDIGEPFWHGVIAWLVARDDVHALRDGELARVLDWIEAQQRDSLHRGRPFSLKGRTARTVLRDAERWHALLARELDDDPYPASGIPRFADGPYEIVELRSEAALAEEGTMMRHCARSYRRLVAKGKVALFSLREGGVRKVTIEVATGAMEVVQAKQSGNRDCTPLQLRVVQRWARRHRLGMAI